MAKSINGNTLRGDSAGASIEMERSKGLTHGAASHNEGFSDSTDTYRKRALHSTISTGL